MDFLFPILGYLLGSIPFGLLLTRAFGYGDIRAIGSGNIGATNVLRTGNKKLAAATLLLDGLKGTLAVFLSFASGSAMIILLTAFMAVIGHMFPVWLKFKGGKGVATTLGVILALMPPLFFAMVAVWGAMASVFRISSLAALTAFALAPVLSWLWIGDLKLAGLCLMLTALVFYKHKENIERLLNGTEPRIGAKKSADVQKT